MNKILDVYDSSTAAFKYMKQKLKLAMLETVLKHVFKYNNRL